ncbi:hypothetical protein METBIDRAFT_34634 [Metschnikowia bicuspidata var. bicuspidata NRRL YB-4993]|uniref:NADH dehydrogenase [ubiquinone] 1 alpha subcomplex subunit n=1 Tax=Metschnikowia bicuspidata var. bicuspidata NRRL YB-4993 TaxID=869754 RepID=A0A1A0HKA4_9ASCO|nr:hypothetical protein METBIDRAFT_34634 [Metschnikowia bicuspidata var. bicuspidata NRRL YB-4993]OBA24233.1 hypothetical protein METBIDRAFT_34634 [Metschnikowia bicuspidata var. bicuspidata NRRL YB-4993]
MDHMASKYPLWKRVLHKFQARRDIPFRKKFFVGYDLHGNTYWEFTIDGNMHRLRRKLEPFQESPFKSDYFETVPPQWLQWLRRTKRDAPTLQELMDDQLRQQRIKILAMHADQKWTMEKQRLEQEQAFKLQAELDKVKQENASFELRQKETIEKSDTADPWAESEARAKENPIESAVLKPRK